MGSCQLHAEGAYHANKGRGALWRYWRCGYICIPRDYWLARIHRPRDCRFFVLLMLCFDVGEPEGGVEKNNPLTTALAPPVRVTRRIRCPLRFHTRYWPPLKLVTLRVSSTALVPASRMSTRSARVLVSKSRQ